MALEELKGTILESIWQSDDRRPAFKVSIWNPRFATVQDVVNGEATSPEYDISSIVESVGISQNQVFENNDSAVSSRADVNIVYPDSSESFEISKGIYIKIDHRLFSENTPIRIYEGDERVASEDWPAVFTGTIRGYPSASIAKRGKRTMKVSAFGRALPFQSQTIVGFAFDYNTDLGDAAVSLAIEELGLKREEIRFGKFGKVSKHASNALTQVSKMRGLYELMMPSGRKPYFDGYGRLVTHLTSFDKPPVWVLDSSRIIKSVERVQNLRATVNSVQVIGLSNVLSEVVSSSSKLGEVNTTLGYFDTHHRETIHYSEDKRRRAKNTYIDVIHDGGFGSGASWRELDEFSGQLSIDTGYAPWVVGAITTAWAILALTEYYIDLALAEVRGIQIPGIKLSTKSLEWSRFAAQTAKAATMLLLLDTMTKMGRFRVEVRGEPFEFVFEEVRAIAHLQGVPAADQVEREIVNHWIDDIDEADEVAKNQLRRELAQSHPYKISMASNGLLAVDDLLTIREQTEGLGTFQTFYITSIRKVLKRGPSTGTMELTAWHCKDRKTLDAI